MLKAAYRIMRETTAPGTFNSVTLAYKEVRAVVLVNRGSLAINRIARNMPSIVE
ncbi:MAG TPA: hypothetical protein VFX43_01125 [Chitinophagaceae bacterium]|nr:hypothetical protein [Chitinophagaceae bacterium]